MALSPRPGSMRRPSEGSLVGSAWASSEATQDHFHRSDNMERSLPVAMEKMWECYGTVGLFHLLETRARGTEKFHNIASFGTTIFFRVRSFYRKNFESQKKNSGECPRNFKNPSE